MSFDSQLPDDLDEIARSIPRVPRAYSRLRTLLALLPQPVPATTQPSFPVAEVEAPGGATSSDSNVVLNSPQAAGTQDPVTGLWASSVDPPSYNDYLRFGLYNAGFAAGVDGLLPLARGPNLPYWTIARDNDAATPTYDNGGAATVTRTTDATYPGGKRLRSQWGALNENTYLMSDQVPVVSGFQYPIGVIAGVTRVAGGLGIISRVRWFDVTGALISDVGVGSVTFSVTTAAAWQDLGTVIVPDTARFAQVVINCFQQIAHNAGNIIDIGAVSFGLGSSPRAALNFIEVDADYAIIAKNFISLLETQLSGSIILGTDCVTLAGNTSFPAGPISDDSLFYRRDLGMWFVYDFANTRWVCTCPHEQTFVMANTVTMPLAATATARFYASIPTQRGLSIVIDYVDCFFNVASGATALDGSNKWVATIVTRTGNVTISTLTINSGASNAYRRVGDTPNALVDVAGFTVEQGLTVTWTKTGTPGDLNQSITFSYRYTSS